MAFKGCSYAKRVQDINEIFDKHAKSGLSNREIWRRYIWPVYAISEQTLYNYINAAASDKVKAKQTELQLTLF
ncbi:hypothetical protein EZS27_004509 [termite gut metagenome]|jgi:hypothetical protein|uniref:Uncharacterized protein n=1 Tax=termite gut metagenome TaxID=433724 RepID=A0A5J4SPW7_9ZZZZ